MIDIEKNYNRLLTRTVYGHWREQYNTSIKKLPFYDSHFNVYKYIYILNDDLTLTLVYKDGQMIE